MRGSSLPSLLLCALFCALPALSRSQHSTEAGTAGLALDQLLPEVRTFTNVSNATELLQAFNRTAGSSIGEVITIRDDIFVRPQDLLPYTSLTPFNGGNQTLVLRGGKPGGKPGGNKTVLDWGGAVNVMYHPAGHSFFAVGLVLQGIGPTTSGFAAGIELQMVGGAFWPTYNGAPGHLMAFWGSEIVTVSPTCSHNQTLFKVASLQHTAGRNDTVQMLGPTAFYVGQQLNGTFAVRNTTDGSPVGNIRWSWYNTTIRCTKPPDATQADDASRPHLAPNNRTSAPGNNSSVPTQQAAPQQAPPQLAADLAALQYASSGIAGSADELLFLLSRPWVTRIQLGVHMSLSCASMASYALPIRVEGRNLSIQSNDASLRVLDLAGIPQLLYLSSNARLKFTRTHLEGLAAPSSLGGTLNTSLSDSPLWPSIDGKAGHQVELMDSVVHAIVTPCSRNSTQITVDLLRKAVGQDGVQLVGATGYAILPCFTRQEPIIDPGTMQEVGSATYTFQNTLIECQEDAWVSLASELAATSNQHYATALAASATATSSSGGTPAWLAAVLAPVLAACALLTATSGWILYRRRRAGRAARRQKAGRTHPAEVMPLTPRAARLDRMESADVADPASLDSAATAAAAAAGGPSPSGSEGVELQRAGSVEQQQGAGSGGVPGMLWRTRFGVIEGLEIGELLGRGAFGKVYRGRWNGAVVAVKVVEHVISAAGEHEGSLSREPLLCMSVSHPNCITTYKLSVIRLLRGGDLLPEEENEARLSNNSDDSATSATGSTKAASSSSIQGRRLRSLLSGAEAVEVADPYGPLQPGLYETWIVSEYCERGTLADALAEGKLRLPDGTPNMVNLLLCLQDIASGMQYLHSLGIMHSDLKPANVLLKGARNSLRGFACKLADFGLSRMLDGRATHVKTGSYGTPTHAAPELLREGRLTPANDVYAFGILAWELVAGEEAFRGQHPMHIIMQVTQHAARPPPLPHCPPSLQALMEACWHEDPAARPTFGALLPKLQPLLREARQQGQPRAGLAASTAAPSMPSSALSNQLSSMGSTAPFKPYTIAALNCTLTPPASCASYLTASSPRSSPMHAKPGLTPLALPPP